MSPRLTTLAKAINAAGYEASVERWHVSTDRKIAGARYRMAGKGRWGNRLVVKRDGVIVFKHNAAETYRSNDEVVRWMEQNGIPLPEATR